MSIVETAIISLMKFKLKRSLDLDDVREISSAGFCRQLAKRGYLVCSLEYRLIPAVRVYEQFDDVWAASGSSGK